MRMTFYRIDRAGRGRLSTMPKPRGGDWLEDDMAAVRRAGVDVLVSALTPDEAEELDLVAEPDIADRAGIEFHAFPIPDRGLPDRAALRTLVAALTRRLSSDAHVAVHCRFGIGRSSLIAAAVLVHAGVAPDDAWDRIRRARGLAVPDTDEQRAFLATLPGSSAG